MYANTNENYYYLQVIIVIGKKFITRLPGMSSNQNRSSLSFPGRINSRIPDKARKG